MSYEELINKNGSLEIDTLLRFDGNNDKVFSFLHLAEKANCTVIFRNENIIVDPKEHTPIEKNMLICFYNFLYENTEIIKNFYTGLCLIK